MPNRITTAIDPRFLQRQQQQRMEQLARGPEINRLMRQVTERIHEQMNTATQNAARFTNQLPDIDIDAIPEVEDPMGPDVGELFGQLVRPTPPNRAREMDNGQDFRAAVYAPVTTITAGTGTLTQADIRAAFDRTWLPPNITFNTEGGLGAGEFIATGTMAQRTPFGPPDVTPESRLRKFAEKMGIKEFTYTIYQAKGGEYGDPATASYTRPIEEAICNIFQTERLGIQELLHNEEAGIESKVSIDNVNFHIPFIDFMNKDLKVIKQAIDFSSETLGADSSNFTYYFSGNSFHAYGDFLLTEEDFMEYTSKLLLIKHPTKKLSRIVDPRWVGHSQLKKSMCLRLTGNTKPFPVIVE